MDTEVIKALVADYYDIQSVRLMSDNRVRAFSQGVSPQVHARIKEMTGMSMKRIENSIKKELQSAIAAEPLWEEWLKDVKGIGPILAAGLIAHIEDVKRFATMSKLWKYAGLSVDDDGRSERLVKGKTLNYDPKFKKFMWLVGSSFVKVKGPGRELYLDSRELYDKKWKTSKDCGSVGCKSKGEGACMDGHKHAAARRRTAKIFLGAVYMKWREIEGLPAEHPYIIGRDGHSHIIDAKYFIDGA